MKKLSNSIGVLLMLCFLDASCSQGYVPRRLQDAGTLPVSITFPAGAAAVTWIDETDRYRTNNVSPDQTSLTLHLPKMTVTPVQVWFPDKEHPLGCVYPGSVTSTKAGGWSAHLLYQFLRKTSGKNIRLYASQFNWKKLTEAAEKLENPWELDEERILTAINDGTFDKSLVTRPKSRYSLGN